MTHSTLLCVGSGLAPRYRANTVQALALPPGSYLQFRYEEDLIPGGLRKQLENGKLNGANVVLGHVDCTPKGRQGDGRCFVIPYRHAKLINSVIRGSIYVLKFELAKHALASDLTSFQRSLPTSSPRWKLASDGRPVLNSKGHPSYEGAWCQEVSDLQLTVTTDNVRDWQTIVAQLQHRDDFSKQSYFFLIEGLFHRRPRKPDGVLVALQNGEYLLQAGQDYELRIFHYDPDSDEHTGEKPTEFLKVELSHPLLTPRGDPLMIIDSPYDEKFLRFSTGEPIRKEYGSLFMRPKKTGIEEQSVPELYFPICVKGSIWKAIRNGFILGSLLTATQLVTILSNGKPENWHTIIILEVLLGLSAGFFVSLGMSKPL
jgi:hypothetical protein